MTLTQRWFWLPALLCAILAGLLFLPGLPGDFIFDDSYNIVENSGIQLQTLSPAAVLDAAFSAQPGGHTRVLPTLTFALDYWRGGGLDPAVFKTTNIVIHVVTTFALAWFFQALLLAGGIQAARARPAAIALSLVWAIHPLHVSSVLYAVQRMQTMGTLFLVLALLAYLRARKSQIDGESGRTGWLLTGLLWALALGSKEDAVLLPAYTLALELTLLHFSAANTNLSARLRKGYLVAALAGVAFYLLWAIPHYWRWDAYPGRNFSSAERLLTQGRVLCMYLGEILLPLPQRMPFYYDWIQPSRGIFQPWTTLPALLTVIGMLAAAWRLRIKRPLFALGIFLFFSAHFITSNVVGLELAFEHRNHFALIGAVLAVGDVFAWIAGRVRIRKVVGIAGYVLLVVALSAATVVRARSWSNSMDFSQTITRIAPASARGWNALCLAYFNLGGGPKADNPNLDIAIATCNKGAAAAPDSIISLTNIVAFEALQGKSTQADWNRYLNRLRQVTMGPENATAIWVLVNYVRNDIDLDENNLLEAIDIINDRAPFKPIESAAMGYFIIGHTKQPDRAYIYFLQAINNTPDPTFAKGIIEELRKDGHMAIANRLQHSAGELATPVH